MINPEHYQLIEVVLNKICDDLTKTDQTIVTRHIYSDALDVYRLISTTPINQINGTIDQHNLSHIFAQYRNSTQYIYQKQHSITVRKDGTILLFHSLASIDSPIVPSTEYQISDPECFDKIIKAILL